MKELQNERALRIAAEAKLEEQKHKVLFADTVTAGSNSILVRELAGRLKQNGLDIGQNRLFEWLRANGYLYRKASSYNLPTQKSLDLKLMEVFIRTRSNGKGHVAIEKTPYITARGQEYFFKRVMADRAFFDERIPEVSELQQKPEADNPETA